MTDSCRSRLVMTCADNISAVQHEKRACRVKCTLDTQGQEATKTNGTTGTESRTKEWPQDSMDLSTPSGSTSRLLHLTAVDTAQFSMVSMESFCPLRHSSIVLLQADLFITRLRSAEPPHVSSFPSLFPWHLVQTSTADTCAACVSTSLRTQGSVSMLRTLDF